MLTDICAKCSMNGQRRVQISTVGSGKCELLMVGYEPDWTDSSTGAPYTGNQYTYIWELLSNIGVNFYVTTLYKCRSTAVSPVCLEYLNEEIETLHPECILFMGEKTLTTVIPGAKFSEYREYSHWYLGSRVLATYDPKYVTPQNEIVYNRFIDDLVYSCRHATAYKTRDLYRSVTLDKDQFHRIVGVLLRRPDIEYIGFDTESNGLDPLVEGSKITSFSFCFDKKVGYNVYLWSPELLGSITDKDREEIIADARLLLTSKKIVVHHAKHEYRMIKVLWGFTPNITDDTMYMSYILYLSYPGISHGLKYLSGRFVNLPPWEETLYRFIALFKYLKRHKSLDDALILEVLKSYCDLGITASQVEEMFRIIKDPDYPIKIREAREDSQDPMYWLVPDKIMESYAGMDAIAPLLLMDKFYPTIQSDQGLMDSYRLMVDGAEAFANVELHGVRLVALDKWSERYEMKLEESLAKLRSFPEVQAYETETGNLFNPGSSKCMTDVLYSRLKLPVVATTEKGSPSTNETALIEMIQKYRELTDPESQRKLSFISELRDYKKFAKIKSAYWEGLKRFIHQGRSFDGHTCQYYPLYGDIESNGRNDIINPGYMLHGTDSVIAGTEVLTSKGLIPIEELCDVKDPEFLTKGFYSVDPDIEVYDGDVYRTPIGFYYGGTRSCVKITTEDGATLTGTPEHPIYTDAGWTSLGDLKEGDLVLRITEDCSYHTRITSVEDAGDQVVYDLVMDVPDD